MKDILLLSGDIETNPRPTLQEVMKEVRKIAADIKEMKQANKATTESLATIYAKLDALSNIGSRLLEVEDKIDCLEQTVTNLAWQVDDLENRSRRSNIIVYGIREEDDKTTEGLENELRVKLIENTLKVNISAIDRIHRLGVKTENKTRPVIFKLLDSTDKTKICKNCSKLQGFNISVIEDFFLRAHNV